MLIALTDNGQHINYTCFAEFVSSSQEVAEGGRRLLIRKQNQNRIMAGSCSVICLAIIAAVCASATADYCNLTSCKMGSHTMCKYPVSSNSHMINKFVLGSKFPDKYFDKYSRAITRLIAWKLETFADMRWITRCYPIDFICSIWISGSMSYDLYLTYNFPLDTFAPPASEQIKR